MAGLDPIIRTVLNMITRYGGTSVLTVSSPGTYDVSTSSVIEINTDYTVKMIAFDYFQKVSGMNTEINTLIRNGDKQVFMLPEANPRPTPAVDSLVYNGIRHSIVSVKDLNPSGSQSILYELYIRE